MQQDSKKIYHEGAYSLKPLVSVVIPTYNRFDYLLNAIRSVKEQTYENIEIIVVNDRSSQAQYYEYPFDGVRLIHLEENSKQVLGYGCAARVRNEGIKVAKGDYIAFLDDDDIWFPEKIEKQIDAMRRTGVGMSCTDGLIGPGRYDPTRKYQKYNAEKHIDILSYIYYNSPYLRSGEFPEIWTLDFLAIHNCCITSSVIFKRELVDKVGYMTLINRSEDYDYWKRILNHTNCIYLTDLCFYYDEGHGDGQNY